MQRAHKCGVEQESGDEVSGELDEELGVRLGFEPVDKLRLDKTQLVGELSHIRVAGRCASCMHLTH